MRIKKEEKKRKTKTKRQDIENLRAATEGIEYHCMCDDVNAYMCSEINRLSTKCELACMFGG